MVVVAGGGAVEVGAGLAVVGAGAAEVVGGGAGAGEVAGAGAAVVVGAGAVPPAQAVTSKMASKPTASRKTVNFFISTSPFSIQPEKYFFNMHNIRTSGYQFLHHFCKHLVM